METGEIISKVRRIEVIAKRAVDTLLQSSYRSVFRGKGLEFSEVREYQYGDDIRYIDWKVSARTGKLHVKEFVEERDLLIYIIFDISASTTTGSSSIRREVGYLIAASLAFSAFRSGDRVGMILFSDSVERVIKPAKSRAQIYRLIRELVISPELKATALSPPLRFLARVLRERAIIFIISDLIAEDLKEAVAWMKRLKLRGNDIVVLKLEDPRDYTLPDVGYVEVEDPESGEHLIIDTSDKKLREAYAKISFEENSRKIEMLSRNGIDVIRVSTAEDFFLPLIRFFQLRERRRL